MSGRLTWQMRTFLGFCFFLCLTITLSVIYAEEPKEHYKGKISEVVENHGWREVRLHIQTNSGPDWCGSSKTLVIGGGDGAGIRLLHLVNGEIQVLTKVVQHSNPSCSRDGRYVFFYHLEVGSSTLWAYDSKTKALGELYSFDFNFFGGSVIGRPLSPSGQYLIAPLHVRKDIRLPGGGTVHTVHVGKPNNDPAKPDSAGSYTSFAWSADSRYLFLFQNSAQLLVIQDLLTNKSQQVPLHAKAFLNFSPHAAPDGTRLFWWATDDDRAYLYAMKLDELDKPPELLIEGINFFDLFPTGELLYSKKTGNRMELIVRRKDGSESLVWETPFRLSKKWGVPSLKPRISPDGEGIIYRYVDDTDQIGYIVLLKRNR